MPESRHTPFRSPLAEAAVCRAVQLIEEDGPLDDAAALREAMAAHPDDRGRLIERAWILGQRLGLVREWARWQRLGGAVLLALALAVALADGLLVRSVLGERREINAVAAVVSLLGLHALTWLAWTLSLLLAGRRDTRGGGALLSRLALQLTARLPLDRGPHALQLARATRDVLARARLSAWAFGGLSHLIWSLSFLVVLAGLVFGFSVRAYRLGWETTILPPEAFLDFVAASGWLPGKLGFPEPDAAALLAGAADVRPSDWAWWLIGCIAIYGLALRLASGALCAWAWRRGRHRLGPDLADPAARRILASMAALAPVEVIDAEQPGPAPVSQPAGPGGQPGGNRMVGFELPPEADWPPQRLSGTQAEREAFLHSLRAAPPRRLLIACHAPSSPDRGTARFLRDAAALAGESALLPLAGDASRWRQWLAASSLAPLALFEDRHSALAWLDEVAA